MKTLTIGQTRQRLGYWGKRALRGEDVGFVVDGRIVALRPVEVHSADYALQEYGLTEKHVESAVRRIHKEVRTERSKGSVKPFTGKLNELRN
jgi:hypothetical protein